MASLSVNLLLTFINVLPRMNEALGGSVQSDLVPLVTLYWKTL